MMEGIKKMEGKKVFVILKSGRRYQGTVDNVQDGIIYMTDKFDEPVVFSLSEISSMEAEKE